MFSGNICIIGKEKKHFISQHFWPAEFLYHYIVWW